MCRNIRLHSCRICSTPVLLVYNYFLSHIAIHGVGIDAYMQKFGGVGDVLEETLEEKMVNTLIANLGCPLCYKVLKGIQHFGMHMRTAHKKNNLANALRCAAKQLGLVNCAECPTRKPVLKDFWPMHVAYFHSGNIQGNRKNFKEKKNAENTT